MIAPRTPLLGWAAAGIIPLAAAGLVPAAALPCLGVFAALVAIASVDAARGLRAVREIAVRLPASLRCTQNCETPLAVEIESGSPGAAIIQVALRLPASVASDRVSDTVTVGPGNSKILWPVTPTKRGDHRIEFADVERASPWSLWSVRSVLPADCVLRVYPNLRGSATRALFLRREMSGIQRQRQVGRGREFEKLRDYLHGDSFDEISWKATARRGKPIVKVFQVERTQELYVAVDASRLSAREGLLEKYVTAALHLGLAAERQGDLFGIVTFSDKVHQFVRARKGKAHYRTCREAIYKLEPRRVSPDFAELFGFIRNTLRRRALLVVLTALDDPMLAESFAAAVPLASRRHLVLANVAQMPGIRPLFEGPPPESTDEVYARVAGQLFWKRLRELRIDLERKGVSLTVLDPDKIETQLASLYLDVKRRQTL
jgi:uncharacterized protein (DUF58 family)